MKRIVFLAVAIFACTFAQAQTEGKFRGGLDFGGAIPGGGFGFHWALEGKYNIADNMNVGLRISSGAFIKGIVLDSGDDLESASVSANVGYLGTFDYYFNSGGNFAPFVGGGLGLFNVAAVGITGSDNAETAGSALEAGIKFGGMLRGGFEVGKFRMGLEYNFIPGSPLINTASEQIGNSQNSYLAITVGFFVGGGRWGN